MSSNLDRQKKTGKKKQIVKTINSGKKKIPFVNRSLTQALHASLLNCENIEPE